MSCCVVFTCNSAYFSKFEETCSQLINNGKYTGDICLVIGNDLIGSECLECEFIKMNKIQIKHFPDFEFPSHVMESFSKLKREAFWNKKLFQFHKFHIFNTFFKQWSRIFYIDCGVRIFAPIAPMLDTFTPGKILAHSDAFPYYKWNLEVQFDKLEPYYSDLKSKYDLTVDYYQTTIMYFDTDILSENIPQELFNLTCTYPISLTNDQGIISLYFINKGLFHQIALRNRDTYFYDYLSRGSKYKYIMLKNAELKLYP
jgi:hypothetical protein